MMTDGQALRLFIRGIEVPLITNREGPRSASLTILMSICRQGIMGTGLNLSPLSESYRRCCTSVAWVGQALAIRLLQAENYWDHDAFFDYVDRWMYEDDSKAVQTIKSEKGQDYSAKWARQGQAWGDESPADRMVEEMWAKYRKTLKAPVDGWETAR